MLYNLLRFAVRLCMRLAFRWQVSGTENIPVGGVIIAPNHISNFDPPVIGSALPQNRRIRFMAKEELFSNPLLRWLIIKLGAFPIRRGAADRTAIRTALKLLQEGGTVGIFPEGTRSKTGDLGRAEPGLAMIAVKAGVPVIPAAVIGTNKMFRSGNLLPQLKVRFAPPVTPPAGRTDKEASEYINTKVMQEIARMLAEEGG